MKDRETLRNGAGEEVLIHCVLPIHYDALTLMACDWSMSLPRRRLELSGNTNVKRKNRIIDKSSDFKSTVHRRLPYSESAP